MTPRFATTAATLLRPIASRAFRSVGLIVVATVLIYLLLPAVLVAAGT